MKTTPFILAGALLAALATPAFAAGSVISTGTGAPPSMLGGYSLTPFPVGYDDPRTGLVTEVPSPLGGVLVFSETMEVLEVGNGWAGWSHGFTGDVYGIADWNRPGPFEVTLALPPKTGAFLFYAQPSPFGVFAVSAALDDGTSLVQDIDGDGGAAGFGFAAPRGSSLVSVTVASEFDFALAEFNIATAAPIVPEAGTWAVGLMMLGAAVLPLARGRR